MVDFCAWREILFSSLFSLTCALLIAASLSSHRRVLSAECHTIDSPQLLEISFVNRFSHISASDDYLKGREQQMQTEIFSVAQILHFNLPHRVSPFSADSIGPESHRLTSDRLRIRRVGASPRRHQMTAESSSAILSSSVLFRCGRNMRNQKKKRQIN